MPSQNDAGCVEVLMTEERLVIELLRFGVVEIDSSLVGKLVGDDEILSCLLVIRLNVHLPAVLEIDSQRRLELETPRVRVQDVGFSLVFEVANRIGADLRPDAAVARIDEVDLLFAGIAIEVFRMAGLQVDL